MDLVLKQKVNEMIFWRAIQADWLNVLLSYAKIIQLKRGKR